MADPTDFAARVEQSHYTVERYFPEEDIPDFLKGEVARVIPQEMATQTLYAILRADFAVSPFYPGATGFELVNGNVLLIYQTDMIKWGVAQMAYIAMFLKERKTLTADDILADLKKRNQLRFGTSSQEK